MPLVPAEWTPHRLLVAGEVDPSRATSTQFPRSNRLVLPDVDLREQAKFDTKEKIDSRPNTLLLRGRRLENAILNHAYLPKVDFGGAQLQGAWLDGTRLQGAWLTGAKVQGASLGLADLKHAKLNWAQLQGASLDGAQLQGACRQGAAARRVTDPGAAAERVAY